MNKHYSYDEDENMPLPTPEERDRVRATRILFVILTLLAISIALGIANAQTTPARTAEISFARPTQYVDETPVAASTAITYSVYQGAKGGTKTRVGTITTTGTTITSGLTPGETCWQVTSTANGIESARSNEACKTFPWPATDVVTITVR